MEKENIFSWERFRDEYRLWCCKCLKFKEDNQLTISVAKFINKKCDCCYIKENYSKYFITLELCLKKKYNIHFGITKMIMNFLSS